LDVDVVIEVEVPEWDGSHQHQHESEGDDDHIPKGRIGVPWGIRCNPSRIRVNLHPTDPFKYRNQRKICCLRVWDGVVVVRESVGVVVGGGDLGGYDDGGDVGGLQADDEQKQGDIVCPLGEVVSGQTRKFNSPLEIPNNKLQIMIRMSKHSATTHLKSIIAWNHSHRLA